MGSDRSRVQKNKVIWLLKHDPFEKAWKGIASDWAPEGQNFKSNNVNRALLEAK